MGYNLSWFILCCSIFVFDDLYLAVLFVVDLFSVSVVFLYCVVSPSFDFFLITSCN